MSSGDATSEGDSSSYLDRMNVTADAVAHKHNADLILFNAFTRPVTADKLIKEVRNHDQRCENVVLTLVTRGGDPHSAYRVARFLKRRYEQIFLLVLGKCKSAGTLITLGGNEIIMGDSAELGPLDMQTWKEDELYTRSSVLDIQQALHGLSSQALTSFDEFLKEIVNTSGGNITTKTASDVASEMSTSLLKPIAQQIDPLRLGEDERAMQIAQEYGERLNPENKDLVLDLITEYPSHSFVIDFEEAKKRFGDDVVRETEKEERLFENVWASVVRNETTRPIVRYLCKPCSRTTNDQTNGTDRDETEEPEEAVSEDSEANAEAEEEDAGNDEPEQG